MSDVTQMSERRAEREAARGAPKGYTLWAVYPTKGTVEMIKAVYGERADVVKEIRGYWALYGRTL